MINSFDDVQAITELTFIIQEETGFGLGPSATIAERLYREGYRKMTPKQFLIVAYAEEGLPYRERKIMATDHESARDRAWREFPEYHEVGAFEC